ncbi:trypsin-like peptidase domain-containing protein [Tsukamurella sp. 8F]|uniref:S1C family serine protease n=1 Tax=unclassified Tsukamurella TaxID=2633480 RepID=UPI0023B8A209|nr:MULTISPECIES: trypsin-like peptidase domain-containing protein [unclassified Tsukamurella]MDF0532598.1 trypsin-like peptidase domain-containing protein [Tsukamurella sp. 8J]MDF0589392.1 trypsin-like peptidase domain-containing protein [Tsukamurella sp. 8F]
MTQGGEPQRPAPDAGDQGRGANPWAYEQYRQQGQQAQPQQAQPLGGYPQSSQAPQGQSQPGYYEQPSGYPAPGQPQGYSPTGQLPAPGGTPPGVPPVGRRGPGGGALATLAIVIALVAALGGGLVGAALTKGSGSGGGGSTMTVAANNGNAPAAAKGSVQDIANRVLPSVVSIEYVAGRSGDSGSGVVLTKDGLIVTNNHVVSGEGSSAGGAITVTFADGSTSKATVVGTDDVSDLAVIKVDRNDLTPITVGDSSKVAVGQDVVAVGAPLGLSGTVTSGIVSALNRPVATSGKSSDQTTVIDSIQTDASINPGNSGGALVNSNGELIGITSSIASLQQGQSLDGQSQQSGSIGLGFAIPANQVKRIAQELIDNKKATHAALGVTVKMGASNSQPGGVISDVSAGGAAERAGIPKGSIVTKIDDLQVPDGIALIGAVRSYAPGTTVTITYVDPGGGTKTAQVKLDTLSN